MLPEITDADFEEVIAGAGLVLVDFWAAWCGPCQRMQTVLEEAAAEFAGRVRFVRLDVVANPAAPARAGVLGLPALFLYRDGQLLDRWGMLSAGQLRKRLQRYL